VYLTQDLTEISKSEDLDSEINKELIHTHRVLKGGPRFVSCKLLFNFFFFLKKKPN
jgi:hypothetical protein